MIIPYRCLLASALTASVVSGHGWMSKPEATFSASAGDKTQFIATIDSASSGLKGSFSTSPAENVASFTKAFKSSSYKSLKALIDDKAKVTVTGATLTCGSADPNAAAQPVPSDLEWSHSDSEGFTASHEGPCEAWCDDTKVFSDENCAANFKTAPAKMPYESSSCSGASKLTFYWMAMHSPTWQVYVNCAPLSGSGGGGTTATSSASSSTADTPTVTSARQQTTPSANTPPSTSTGSSTGSSPSTSTGSSTGSSPSATTAPSSGSTPTVTSAPSTGSTQSANSPPSTSTGVESDCGSLDVAGSGDGNQYDSGTDTSTGTTTQGSTTGGTGQNTWGTTTQGSGTSTTQGSTTGGTGQNMWGTTTQGSSTGGTNQYWGTGGTTNQGSGTQTTQQYTGSSANIGFNSFQNQGWNAGTVAPQ